MAIKIIAVFGPDNRYLSHCTEKRAASLLNSQRATRVNATTIKLIYTKKGWVNVKHELIKKANRICYICKRQIPENEIATIDHVIPSSRSNQANIYSNLQCCCEECNHDKDNKKLSEYVQHIKRYRENYEHISDSRLEELESFALQFETDFYLNSENIIYIHRPYNKKNFNKKKKKQSNKRRR